MLYRNDIIIESLQDWENMLVRLTKFADKQDSQERLTIYQFIYSIQDDIYKIKSLINSLHKKPGAKVQLKQGLIFEMFTKLTHKIAESETVKKAIPDSAFAEVENQDIDQAFDKAVQKLGGLSGKSSDKFTEEMQELIDKVDSSLEGIEEWSSKNLSSKCRDFRENFLTTLNKIHYYKYKSQAWIVRISEKSAESIDDIRKDLSKTCRSFRITWKKLHKMHTAKS